MIDQFISHDFRIRSYIGDCIDLPSQCGDDVQKTLYSESRRAWIDESLKIEPSLFYEIDDEGLRTACLRVPCAISKFITCFFEDEFGTSHQRSCKFKEVLEDFKLLDNPSLIVEITENPQSVFRLVSEGFELRKIIHFLNRRGSLSDILENYSFIHACSDQAVLDFIEAADENLIYCMDQFRLKVIVNNLAWVTKLLDHGMNLQEFVRLEQLSFFVLDVMNEKLSEEEILSLDKSLLLKLLCNLDSHKLVKGLSKNFETINVSFLEQVADYIHLALQVFQSMGYKRENCEVIVGLISSADVQYFNLQVYNVCRLLVSGFSESELSRGLVDGIEYCNNLLQAGFYKEQVVQLGQLGLICGISEKQAKLYYYLCFRGFSLEDAFGFKFFINSCSASSNTVCEQVFERLCNLVSVGIPAQCIYKSLCYNHLQTSDFLKWLDDRRIKVQKIYLWGDEGALQVLETWYSFSKFDLSDKILKHIEDGLEWEAVSPYLLNPNVEHCCKDDIENVCDFVAFCKRHGLTVNFEHQSLEFVRQASRDFSKLENFVNAGLTIDDLFSFWGVIDIALNHPQAMKYYRDHEIDFAGLYRNVSRGKELLTKEYKQVTGLLRRGVTISRPTDLQELLHPTDTLWYNLRNRPLEFIFETFSMLSKFVWNYFALGFWFGY